MVEKITKLVSNLKFLSKINEIIDGLNTHTTNTNNPHNVTAEQLGLATAYVYKGSVTNFSDLPTNAQNGWVYSVENEHTDSAGILHPAGANFAWNGSKWDDLGGSLSGYTKSVNSQSPDNKGNINLTLVESLEKNTEDKLIVHNADGTTQELEVGKKYTINGKLPDSTDNYDINEYEGYWEAKENVSVGDVRFLKGRNNTKYLLECVQEGTTGTEQPTISDNTDLIDNTAKWGVRKLTKFQESSGLPVGFEYFSTNPNIPAGSLPLFGGEYSRTVYADLWSWVQEQAGYLIEESEWQEKSNANEGNVPFYSKGNGTTTFRVPSLKCWVKGANGIEEVGSYLSAGLPNIEGNIEKIGYKGGVCFGINTAVNMIGAFNHYSNGETGVAHLGTQTTIGDNSIQFDASRSNPIYGNSDTVQPKSIVGMWLVKAYGTVTNVGSTDVANIASGLTEVETNKLSLSGGTMSGTITLVSHTICDASDTNVSLIGKDDTKQVAIWANHATSVDGVGGQIYLNGINASQNAGGIGLYAHSKGKNNYLDVRTNGIFAKKQRIDYKKLYATPHLNVNILFSEIYQLGKVIFIRVMFQPTIDMINLTESLFCINEIDSIGDYNQGVSIYTNTVDNTYRSGRFYNNEFYLNSSISGGQIYSIHGCILTRTSLDIN